MQVVMGHWGTWDDDALIVDKSGRFEYATKLHRLGHEGKWFKSRGPCRNTGPSLVAAAASQAVSARTRQSSVWP